MPFDKGPVGFVYLACSKGLTHAAESLGGAGEEDETRGGAVEAVDDADEGFAWFVVACGHVDFSPIFQAGITCGIALNEHARWLVDQ